MAHHTGGCTGTQPAIGTGTRSLVIVTVDVRTIVAANDDAVAISRFIPGIGKTGFGCRVPMGRATRIAVTVTAQVELFAVLVGLIEQRRRVIAPLHLRQNVHMLLVTSGGIIFGICV